MHRIGFNYLYLQGNHPSPVYWNLFTHTVSVFVLILCFQLSAVSPTDGALSEFSSYSQTNNLWFTFLWVQATHIYINYIQGNKKKDKYLAIVCSLSLAYISFYGIGECLHNEVALLFFASFLLFFSLRSKLASLTVLCLMLLSLVLFKGYAPAELIFYGFSVMFNLLGHCNSIRTAFR